MEDRNSLVNTWGVADTTLGNVGFVGIVALGSAVANNITLLDGTAIKHVLVVSSTSNATIIPSYPVAFSNLIIDNSGTAAYSIMYVPRP